MSGPMNALPRLDTAYLIELINRCTRRRTPQPTGFYAQQHVYPEVEDGGERSVGVASLRLLDAGAERVGNIVLRYTWPIEIQETTEVSGDYGFDFFLAADAVVGKSVSATLTDNATTNVNLCTAVDASKVHVQWDAKHNDRRESGHCDVAVDGSNAYILNRVVGTVGSAQRVIKTLAADISSGTLRLVITTESESVAGTLRLFYMKVAPH